MSLTAVLRHDRLTLSRKRQRGWRRGLCKVIVTVLLGWMAALPVHARPAQEITTPHAEITQVTPGLRDGRLYLDADIDLELGPELRSAAEKGLVLHFVIEAQITSKYRWWFNKTVVDAQRSYRLSYNVLTRQWRVGTRDWAVPQATLDDALSTLRHVRGWAVSGADAIRSDARYEGRMRLRLDTARLPRPFQIDALNSSVWTLAAPWKTFQFELPAF